MKNRKKSQNIDRLIQGVRSIQLNRCSPSDDDYQLLEELVTELETHRPVWQRGDPATLLVIIKAAVLLSKFFRD